MAIVIIDQFKLGTNLPLDDRYINVSLYDVSEYWYPGMQVYQTSDQKIYYYNGNTWQPIGNDSSIGEILISIQDVSIRVANLESSVAYLNTQDLIINASIFRIDSSINELWSWNLSQDTSIVNIINVNATQDASITDLRNVNAAQDASITNLRNVNVAQDASITDLRNVNTAQDASITNLRNVNVAQDASITDLRNVNTAQDASITDLRNVNTAQDASISFLRNWNLALDGSIVRIDGSINYLFTNKADLVDGKVPLSQIPDSVIGGMTYMGSVCPSSGTVDASIKGQYYIITCDTSAYGYTLNTGDWLVFNGLTANPSWGKSITQIE